MDNKEEDDEEEYGENNKYREDESSDSDREDSEEMHSAKPLPATNCAVPEIYAISKRVVLLLGKVTSL